MLQTLDEFAQSSGLSARHVRRLAARTMYTWLVHEGVRYQIVASGTSHRNGKPLYQVNVPEAPPSKRRHLADSERMDILNRLNAGEGIDAVASAYGVDYTTIYRLKRFRNDKRKKRKDARRKRFGVPPGAEDLFHDFYLQNAQRNAALALHLVERKFPGVRIPYHYALDWAAELNAVHTATHYASKFENEYTPHIRRDLWAEYEFLEQVLFDCWKADLWVTENGKQTQPMVIACIDLKTRHVLAWKSVTHSVTGEDVVDVALALVYKYGRPGQILLDNGSEFSNELVMRFLQGCYTTEEHEVKERVIFSEAYHPQSKAALERLFRIFKDEFCAFTPSYSPNQFESRKPTKRLSHVQGDWTLGEFRTNFQMYLNGLFLTRPRSMWQDPKHTRAHEVNRARPSTMSEALDRAYRTFTPNEIETSRLAVLYAKKFRKRLRGGIFRVTYLGEQMLYVPAELPVERYNETFDVLINPLDLSQAWVLTLDGAMLCEAVDYARRNVAGEVRLTRESAGQVRKLRNKAVAHARASARARTEADALAEACRLDVTVPLNNPDPQEAVASVFESIRTAESEEDFVVEIDDEFTNALLNAIQSEAKGGGNG